MTSRELTLRAIEFRNPERIPLCLSIDHDQPENITIDQEISSRYTSDILLTMNRNPNFFPDKHGQDEWGCIWKQSDKTMGEVVEHPISSWDMLNQWKQRHIPDYCDAERYKHVRDCRAYHDDQFIMGGIGFMMMNLINLRGYTGFMTDLLLERKNIEELIEILYEAAFQQIDKYAEIGLDAVIAWEDWGLQDRCMISPVLWREVFKDRMAEMIRHIHARGMKYVFHCCGYILDIMDDIIETGVDVIQLDQQIVMGLDRLHDYAGEVCFFNPVDIQFSSGNNDFDSIKKYCKSMAEALSVPEGGFMYKTYSQPAACSISLDTILTECKAFSEIEIYRPAQGSKP